MKWKEDDLALVLITGIEGTTIFLELEDKTKGSMILSEVAPGRIRNLREFVTVGKKIVCKVLRVQNNHIELSLRRVSAKERELVLEGYKKEKSFQALLKPILKEKTQEIIEKIAAEHELVEVFDTLKTDQKVLEKYLTKTELEQLKKLVSEKKDKAKEVRKKIFLKTMKDNGLKEIQEVLKTSEAEVHYLGSGMFSIAVTGTDFKQLNAKIEKITADMYKRAKEKAMLVEIK